MKKRAQDYSGLSQIYDPRLAGKSLADLYLAIRSDAGLDATTKAQIVGQIKGMTGYANESTPLSALMMKGLGGIIGWLISKYFGLGPVGQLISAAAGYGMGNVINEQLNKPPNPYPGWRML